MKKSEKLNKSVINNTIRCCIDNGKRLIEESYDLEFRNPPLTRFFIIMIAQEELAKAFLLVLVKMDIIPFTPLILRSINDHSCKQLVSMIMDYMIMHWEWDRIEDLDAMIDSDYALGDLLPNDVGSAMEILRYEKIGRWKSKGWEWAEDPKYDPLALGIADGKKDRRKQDALYVRVGRDGRVCNTVPPIDETETRSELGRAGRYITFVETLSERGASSSRHEKAIDALKVLFETLSDSHH